MKSIYKKRQCKGEIKMSIKKKLLTVLIINICIFGVTLTVHADMTGVWLCDDRGVYYIRQIRDTVWWYGENSATNTGWSNVAYGEIIGNQIHLDWADVPKGSIMGKGKLILEIGNAGQTLRALRKTGSGFGGSNWKKR